MNVDKGGCTPETFYLFLDAQTAKMTETFLHFTEVEPAYGP